MTNISDDFDDIAYASLSIDNTKRSSVACDNEISRFVESLDTSSGDIELADSLSRIHTFDKKAKVSKMVDGSYRVKLSSCGRMYALASFLSNERVSIKFTEDLLHFTPEEDLIFKSKVPLWVICPVGNKTVMIKRFNKTKS